MNLPKLENRKTYKQIILDGRTYRQTIHIQKQYPILLNMLKFENRHLKPEFYLVNTYLK